MPDEEILPNPGKRLALFFDGTWNIPENNTNVWRLYLMLGEYGADGMIQKSFYDEGVGTYWAYRVSGGVFGAGLSENVRSGYRWLMQHYNLGDEIYLFGFSRGAFTARSLAGLIARCGLLKPDAPMSFWDVFERYRKGDAVRPIYQLRYLQKQGKTDFDFEEKVLLNNSWYHRNLIKMVGVWDTVGFKRISLWRARTWAILCEMPRFLPPHIAALVLIVARLHVLHSREHASDHFFTLTPQSRNPSVPDGM